MKNKFLIIVGILILFSFLFRIFFGVFVIQPIGAIPEGLTIIYWRSGMNLPFISSADGILQESEGDVSILGRALVISTLVEPIKKREILRFGYSEMFYLWSTNGIQYEK